MQANPNRDHGRLGPGPTGVLLAASLLLLAACSENSLMDLGGRSSDWIGEVATTAPTTTTVPAVVTRSAMDVTWFNDEYGAPDSDLEDGEVLATVFARSGGSSRFLQASREEIVAVVPDVRFPSILPVEVSSVTSQLVIESRELVLADDPTVAFGLWSVEPYTRSRSVGQVAVLNLSRDPEGVELAAAGDPEAVCTVLVTGDRVCGVEEIDGGQVWRLEDSGVVIHVWYSDPFRYELQGRGFDESLVHRMIGSTVPLSELLPE